MQKLSYCINDYKVRIYMNGFCVREIFYNALTPKEFLVLVNVIKNSITNEDESNLNIINSMIDLFKSECCLVWLYKKEFITLNDKVTVLTSRYDTSAGFMGLSV